ncbi:MAG: Mov34/MPN/PAD-1 family protein [Gaiellaceae bacterium]
MVVPPDVKRELAEHAHAEAPNEACGLLVLEDGVARRYVRGRNVAASPYRFELEIEPETWFLEDEDAQLAVFHSHLTSPPRPSRTDVENIGLWEGRPYFIYTVRTDELAAWRISKGGVEALPLTLPGPEPR